MTLQGIAAALSIVSAALFPALSGALPQNAPLDPRLRRSLETVEAALAKLRGLPFKSEVATAELTREGAREYIGKILHAEYPPEKLAAEEESLRYFGFIGPAQNLERLYLDLMGSQVAGLYDPPSRTLFVVQGMPAGMIALAHELSHALMDQHFDLDALEKQAKESDDRSLALSSLIEGEATMVMTLMTVQGAGDPNLSEILDADPDEIMRESEAGMKGIPPFLRDTLIFPYTGGMAWAGEVMRHGGGLKALDDYFRTPPDSSEQILHPEKSFPPRDVPSRIDPALAATGIPKDAPIVKTDGLGEFATRFLLGGAASRAASDAASGWDGDLYVIAGQPGAYFFNWVSVWDTEEDAAEFESAIGEWLSGRAAANGPPGRDAHATGREGRVVVVTEGAGESVAGSAAVRRTAILGRLPQGIELL